jgi:hypothetical protein
VTKKKQPASRWYRGCYLEYGYTAPFTGMYWQWSTYVDGHGGLYADTLTGIKALVRDALAEQGLKRSPM